MDTIDTPDLATGRLAERDGDDAWHAFHDLADGHLDAAYRLAWSILRDPVEAQDATHDAFVQAWRRWPSLRDQDRLQAWFDRILVNTCRDRLRRQQRWPTSDISAEVAERSAGAVAPREQDAVEAARGPAVP